jgi:hypothetical protein
MRLSWLTLSSSFDLHDLSITKYMECCKWSINRSRSINRYRWIWFIVVLWFWSCMDFGTLCPHYYLLPIGLLNHVMASIDDSTLFQCHLYQLIHLQLLVWLFMLKDQSKAIEPTHSSANSAQLTRIV